MSTYNIAAQQIIAPAKGVLFRVSFGDPATNNEIVKAAISRLKELNPAELGGGLAIVNGPASLPVAFALAHGLAHYFGAVGCFDPKLGGYVVAISHDPRWAVGDVIPATEVKTES